MRGINFEIDEEHKLGNQSRPQTSHVQGRIGHPQHSNIDIIE